MKPFRNMVIRLLAVCLLIPGDLTFAQPGDSLDPELQEFQNSTGLSGTLTSVGSDSLANLMILWAESFKKYHPGVQMEIQATGSSTAPPALASGDASIGPMSRLMTEQEIQDFESRTGYKPTPFTVALDALAVFVHPQNPIEGLSLPQLDAIFSATQSCGSTTPLRQWQQLGLGSSWEGKDIELFGRNSISGTHQYFRLHALCNGQFLPEVQEQPGSASVVLAVSKATAGIGYSALGYTSESVRVLPLSRTPGQAFVAANRENAINGSYPLARLLYIYVNHDPAQPWNPLIEEFIRMVYSKQGQQQVIRDGFAAIPASVARRELQKLVYSPLN